jgi:copper oxidase (laccase) domain-containing protein
MIKYEKNNFFVSFKVEGFLLLTTTKEIIVQNSLPLKECNVVIPYLTKEKCISLYSFLTKYVDLFANKTILMCEQIHGVNIIYANQKNVDFFSGILQINNSTVGYKIFFQSDGIISNSKQDIIAIFTADCIPLFVIDNKNKWFALVHVGRKGLQNGIVRHLFEKLFSLPSFSLKDTLFIAGPHICKDCYYVNGEKYSLVDILFSQLRSFNIKHSQLIDTEICTFHNKRFFSYRRDTTSYRAVSVITQL